MNANIKFLEEKYGDNAPKVFAEIANLSGAGVGFGNHDGGIDLTGALDPENSAISDEAKARIELLMAGDPALLKPAESAPAESTEDATEAEAAPDENAEAEALAKAHSRDQLVEMAKEKGLDGDSYTNKTELAKAILAGATNSTQKDGE